MRKPDIRCVTEVVRDAETCSAGLPDGRWVNADPDDDAPSKFGGWYCEPCDAFSEHDVEVED